MNRAAYSAIVALVLFGSTAVGQESAQPSQPSPDNMEKMATTVTSMAEVCKQMMDHEMALMPYKIAAGICLGLLITVVLLLLVVLEVQWIIYWSRLLKAQKRPT